MGKPRFESRKQVKADLSHPAIAVNLDACIQCTRCLRACREEQVNDVIGYAFRGEHSKIVFDFDDPMGAVDLRRLRRVRAGLPDRRADAGARSRPRRPSTRPWTRCARSAASAACSPTTSTEAERHQVRHRQGRPVEPQPPVRQGPLRLRLRCAPAAPDQAADPQAGLPENPRISPSIRRTFRRCSAKRPGKRRWILPPTAS